jgi:hypothetical protein
LRAFENRVLMNVFGIEREEVTIGCRKSSDVMRRFIICALY